MSFKLVSGSVILLALCISSTLGVPQCACPRQYAPVCGSDGNVYSNKCILDCAKSMLRSDLSVAKEGPCETPTSQCVCELSHIPVCGTDGVTYSNVCQLRCARQKNPALEVYEQGACGDLKRSKRDMPYERRYSLHRRVPCSF